MGVSFRPSPLMVHQQGPGEGPDERRDLAWVLSSAGKTLYLSQPRYLPSKRP